MKLDLTGVAWRFGVVLLPVLLAGFYLLIGPTLDTREQKKSEEFCASLKIGAPIQQLATRAKSDGVKITTWLATKEGVRHQAWFGGFLANGFSCEILERDGLEAAKFTEAHTW